MSPKVRHTVRHLRLGSLLLALWLTALPGLAQPDTSVREDFYAGRFAQGIDDYGHLPAAVQSSAVASFWAAQCYLRLHLFREAEPLLEKACGGNLQEPQRGTAEKLRERVERLKALCPPLDREDSGIRVYARKTAWAGSIEGQLPRFLARARQVFGEALPPVSFYLFEERPAYETFFTAMTASEKSTGHRGTGSYGMVLFCQFFVNGKQIGQRDPDALFGRVLHEYGHALCSTIYGDGYPAHVPQWLNEGVADAVGSVYSSDPLATARRSLSAARTRRQAPSYDELCHHLYADGQTGYAMGDLMVDEILQGQQPSAIGRIITTARANHGDFEGAVRQVTGKDTRAVYQHVLTAYWSGPSRPR